jgi:hypothetical protein
MQTTDFGDRDDRTALRRLDWATVGGVLVEREMCVRLMVVREVADQDATQVPFDGVGSDDHESRRQSAQTLASRPREEKPISSA